MTRFDREADLALIDESRLPHLRGRELIVRPTVDPRLLRGRAQRVGVDRHLGGVLERNLLVVGTGRCGTTWLSRTLERAGVDAPHECVGGQGSVSCLFYADHRWYPFTPWTKVASGRGRTAHVGERFGDFTFRHVVHLVRHPLDCEASIRGMLITMAFHWARDCGVLTVPWDLEPKIVRNFYYWRDVVRRCEAVAGQTIRVSCAADADWHEMLERAGLPRSPMPRLTPRNRSSGYRRRMPLTWLEARDFLPRELYRDVRELTRELNLETREGERR